MTSDNGFGWLKRLMPGYLSFVLHAHLPFIRHPEHGKFLEENWLFEAITETYIPLLQLLESWEKQGLEARITATLTPTLCSMLLDPLLQERYAQKLEGMIELAEKEMERTSHEAGLHGLAVFYFQRLLAIQTFYQAWNHNLLQTFRELQERGRIEIIGCAATHALLPLLAHHRPSLLAQVMIGRDDYTKCFGYEPRGMWLPECAYCPEVLPILQQAGIQWFVLETHGILLADPQPSRGTFAPILTSCGAAAFGRDRDSAQQVWSREQGYPGDSRYRDFYRDIGFDLELEYLQPFVSTPGLREFTGLKYYSIGNGSSQQPLYDRQSAMEAVDEHAAQFLQARRAQIEASAEKLDAPPIIVCPYDAELFGHWWFEGPEFLDAVVRKACKDEALHMITPGDYLCKHRKLQIAEPAASSWGEGGYFDVWLNEKNQWMYPLLSKAQEKITELANCFKMPGKLQSRVLRQAARELLLSQASDWPFMINAGTNAEFAEKRIREHLSRFSRLFDEIHSDSINEQWLETIESQNNLFPDVNYQYWSS